MTLPTGMDGTFGVIALENKTENNMYYSLHVRNLGMNRFNYILQKFEFIHFFKSLILINFSQDAFHA